MLTHDAEPTLLEERGWIRPGASTWILRFDWPTNPLPMNGSRGKSFYGRAAKTKRVRLRSAYVAAELAQIPHLGRIEARLTQWVTTRRTRDLDNLAQLEKPLFDGLVDAGLVDDDSPELMVKPRAQILHVDDANGILRTACFTLRIEQLDTTTR